MFIPPLNGGFLKVYWNKVGGFWFIISSLFIMLLNYLPFFGFFENFLGTTKSWFCISLSLAVFFHLQSKFTDQLRLALFATLFGLFLYFTFVPHNDIALDLSDPAVDSKTKALLHTIMLEFYFTLVALVVFYSVVFSAIYGKAIAIIFHQKTYFKTSDWNPRLLRMHSAYIWTFLISIGFGFLIDIKDISIYFKNIAAFLAFGPMMIQGFYVFDHILRSMKISRFFRHLIQLFVVLQMFFVLIALGFADFWLDLRRNSFKSLFTKGKRV